MPRLKGVHAAFAEQGRVEPLASEAVVQAGFREPLVGFCDLFGQAGARLGLEAVMPSAHILVEIFSGSVAGKTQPSVLDENKWLSGPQMGSGPAPGPRRRCGDGEQLCPRPGPRRTASERPIASSANPLHAPPQRLAWLRGARVRRRRR